MVLFGFNPFACGAHRRPGTDKNNSSMRAIFKDYLKKDYWNQYKQHLSVECFSKYWFCMEIFSYVSDHECTTDAEGLTWPGWASPGCVTFGVFQDKDMCAVYGFSYRSCQHERKIQWRISEIGASLEIEINLFIYHFILVLDAIWQFNLCAAAG